MEKSGPNPNNPTNLFTLDSLFLLGRPDGNAAKKSGPLAKPTYLAPKHSVEEVAAARKGKAKVLVLCNLWLRIHPNKNVEVLIERVVEKTLTELATAMPDNPSKSS